MIMLRPRHGNLREVYRFFKSHANSAMDFSFILFIQYFERVTHVAVISILPCDPLCKHIYIYTKTKVK